MGIQAERILIVRPSALGDVCRTVPVLASLRAAFPGARIDWLVQDTFVDAVAAHPALDGVVSFARERYGRWYVPRAGMELLRWLRGLGRAGYDLVLDCQGLARSGFFAWCTRARERVGYRDGAEFSWLGLSKRVDAPVSMHTVDRMLRLVEAVGAAPVRDMRLYAPAREWEAVEGDAGLGEKYAVLAPAARWEGKRWPAERFARVAEELLRCGAVGCVVVVGSGGEREQCGPVLALADRGLRVADRVGRTSVGGLMALVERAALVIANDSAALHMAVGFDRPLVGLYGPTRVERVGPYGREGDVLQVLREGDVLDHKDAQRGRALMERITVEMVLERAAAVVRGGK